MIVMFNLTVYFERHFRKEYQKGRKASKVVEKFGAFKGLDKSLINKMCLGVQIYKIGYIGLSREITQKLKNNEQLTKEEILEYRRYPKKGIEILASKYQKKYDNSVVAGIIREHKERLDGCGYPSRISGETILETTYISSVCINFVEKFSQGKTILKIVEELELDEGFVPEELKKEFLEFLSQKSDEINEILNS